MRNSTDKKLTALIHRRARAVHLRNPWIGLRDLCQQAWLEMLEAKEKFDPDKGEFLSWARLVINKRLNDYAGLCNSQVSAPSFRQFKRCSVNFCSQTLDTANLQDRDHPEQLLGNAQTLEAIGNIVAEQLSDNPDAGVLLRVLTEETTIRRETSDLTERIRLRKALSRVRKQLRELPALQKLFELVKESTFDE